jgi:hypothetical protein
VEGVKKPSKKKSKGGVNMDKIKAYIYLRGEKMLFIDNNRNNIVKDYNSNIFNIKEDWKVKEAGLLETTLKIEDFKKVLNINNNKTETFPRILTKFLFDIHLKELDIKIKKENNFNEQVKIKVIEDKILFYYQNLIFEFKSSNLKDKFIKLAEVKESYNLNELLKLKNYFHCTINIEEIENFILF